MSGCGATSAETDSEQVETRDIWAGINLEARGNGVTRVKVELNENNSFGANIRLTANERLDVEASGTVVTLEEDLDIGDIDYEGTIPTDAGGTFFRITLFRADGTTNSGSTATIPDPFDVTLPFRGGSYVVGNAMALQWTPGGVGDIDFSVLTSCPIGTSGRSTRIQSFTLADTGSHIFDTNRLSVGSDPEIAPGTRCDMEIGFRRTVNGALDRAFRGGGFVRAAQDREVDNLTLRLP